MLFQGNRGWQSIPPIVSDGGGGHLYSDGVGGIGIGGGTSTASRRRGGQNEDLRRRQQNNVNSVRRQRVSYSYYDGRHVFDDLRPNTVYVVRIRARNKYGWTDEETHFQFRTSMSGASKAFSLWLIKSAGTANQRPL